MTQNKILHNHFKNIWKPSIQDFEYSGMNLVDEINDLSPSAVLDVGCGYNPFKNKIHNLYSIDPYNSAADEEVGILDFVSTKKYNVILALGSINFGNRSDIENQVEKVLSLCTDDGVVYFRVNPGIPDENSPLVKHYPWSSEIIHDIFVSKFGLRLSNINEEFNGRLVFTVRK